MQQHCDHLVFFNLLYSPWSQNGNKPNFFLCNRSHNCTSLTISFVGPSFWLKRRFWLTKPASLNLLSILLKQARTKQLILLYYTIWSASQEWLRFYCIVSGVRNAATNHAIWYRRLADGSYWALYGCSETIHTPAVVPMRLKPTFCCSQHEVATRRTVNAHAPRDHYVQSFFIVLFGGSNLCRLQSALSWPRSRDYYQVREIVVRNKSEPKKGETRSLVPLLNKPRTRNSKAAAVSRVRLETNPEPSRLTLSALTVSITWALAVVFGRWPMPTQDHETLTYLWSYPKAVQKPFTSWLRSQLLLEHGLRDVLRRRLPSWTGLRTCCSYIVAVVVITLVSSGFCFLLDVFYSLCRTGVWKQCCVSKAGGTKEWSCSATPVESTARASV